MGCVRDQENERTCFKCSCCDASLIMPPDDSKYWKAWSRLDYIKGYVESKNHYSRKDLRELKKIVLSTHPN